MAKTKNKKGKKPRCGAKCRQIREYIAKNMDYFRENPAHLGWVMMHYNAIWVNGRVVGGQCDDNPKYPIIDLQESFKLSEEDSSLIYDAWCQTQSSMGGNFHDVGPHQELLLKRFKTYDDWVAIKSDPQHEYSSLWPTQDSIDHNLFLTGGCGMSWTPEGYIDYTGPNDVSESVFAGFSRAGKDVREDIRKKIEDIIASPGLDWARDWVETGTLRATVSKPAAQCLDYFDCGWARKSLQELPKERHQEFYDGLTFVCHYEHLMDDIIPRWAEKDWEEASQSDVYDMYGTYQLDLSKITLNTCYDARTYVSVGRGYKKRTTADDKEDKEFAAKCGISLEEVADLDKERIEKPLIEYGFSGFLSLGSYDDAHDLLEKIKVTDALRGWDVIRLHKKQEIARKQERDAEEKEKSKDKEPYSYLDRGWVSPYDRITNFPDNAHISYVHGCIAFCNCIAAGEADYSEKDRKKAPEIVESLRKRFLEKKENNVSS